MLENHDILLEDGAVLNCWGIEEAGVTADFVSADTVEALGLVQGLMTASSNTAGAEEDVKNKKNLEIAESVFETCASFCKIISACIDDQNIKWGQLPGGICSSSAGILGIAINGIGGYTLLDVMDGLKVIEDDMGELKTEVKALPCSVLKCGKAH